VYLLFYLFLIILTVVFMELFAIFAHKYIMHGPGWFLHKSHHVKNNNKSELNDLYFVIFSLPSIYFIIKGILIENYIFLSIGIGILFYGIIYILLHDIFVHKRFGFNINFKNPIFKKIKVSHRKHHNSRTKDNCTNFGFIYYK